MCSRIFLRCNSGTNYFISQTQARRYLSQTILSLKPTVTRALRDAREKRIFGSSKIHICTNLRSGVCKQNRKILGERNSSSFTAAERSESTLDINTNFTNNVFLYKYEKPKLYRFFNIFAPLQGIFWLGVSYILYTLLPKWDRKNEAWTKYAFDNFIVICTGVTAITTGIMSTLLIWAFSSRSVRYLILRKGGKFVSFITYHPLKKNIAMTVPIESITCSTTRKDMKNYLPLKVKGRRFFYILDAGGEFTNRRIFDNLVAIQRLY